MKVHRRCWSTKTAGPPSWGHRFRGNAWSTAAEDLLRDLSHQPWMGLLLYGITGGFSTTSS
jgi:hypothetical protein